VLQWVYNNYDTTQTLGAGWVDSVWFGKDSDNDGLPDNWETQYFGNLTQTGSGDFDGDGKTNLAEFRNGTDPTSAASK